jgi:hypothetical protein
MSPRPAGEDSSSRSAVEWTTSVTGDGQRKVLKVPQRWSRAPRLSAHFGRLL